MLTPEELARERVEHLRRMQAKYAKEPPTVPGVRKRPNEFSRIGRMSYADDFLPPDDLTARRRK